jgi:hypothetical protein
MRELRNETRITHSLRPLAVVAFLGYLAWNLAWLVQGRIPDSIWRGVTGWPCATSGCTRSLRCLWEGNYRDAVLFNPMTLAYISLLLSTAWVLYRRFQAGRQLLLPRLLAYGWLASLGMGWLLKLAIGRAYW